MQMTTYNNQLVVGPKGLSLESVRQASIFVRGHRLYAGLFSLATTVPPMGHADMRERWGCASDAFEVRVASDKPHMAKVDFKTHDAPPLKWFEAAKASYPLVQLTLASEPVPVWRDPQPHHVRAVLRTMARHGPDAAERLHAALDAVGLDEDLHERAIAVARKVLNSKN